MAVLRKASVHPDPIQQFEVWYQEAVSADINLPNAMSLATATPDGIPSVRIVLLRQVDERGFVFFTNYESSKGRDLRENPQAALVFYWNRLGRQVRITGQVAKVSKEESDAYFKTRPKGSQVGAWASPQSRVIANRDVLLASVTDHQTRFKGNDIMRPSHWGGFRVIPKTVEFWQDQPNRLHDRLRYCRGKTNRWTIDRLAP